jgi:NAD(P)-dependent dehydrogenase (short-subunit alcohol dehydrogenase family)
VATRSVLITGTSTGIGRACALWLDRAGFEVFAGVRRAEDGEKLRAEASDRLRPVTIEVTDAGSIAAAAREVDAALGGRPLGGLVNNAGVSVGGPLEFLPLDELRRVLEVNLVGHVAVTQAFLPAIRRGKGGRVLNITSVGGRIVNPFIGPYHASKWGLEAVTEALRKELRPWRIRVVAIEPGSIQSELWRRGTEQAEEVVAGLPPEGRELYGPAIPKALALANRLAEHAIPADRVAKVVERALTTRRPRARYVVGADARALIAMHRILPARVMDAIEARLIGI